MVTCPFDIQAPLLRIYKSNNRSNEGKSKRLNIRNPEASLKGSAMSDPHFISICFFK